MRISEQAMLIYRQNQPMRSQYVANLSDMEIAMCQAIDKQFERVFRQLAELDTASERTKSRLHRIESKGDDA